MSPKIYSLNEHLFQVVGTRLSCKMLKISEKYAQKRTLEIPDMNKRICLSEKMGLCGLLSDTFELGFLTSSKRC